MINLKPIHISRGITLIELLIALTLGAMILVSLGGVISQTLLSYRELSAKHQLSQQANFVLNRIITMSQGSDRLILPLADNPGTSQNESIHTAFSFSMGAQFDRDFDGFPDIDNDRDGKINEDWDVDSNNDGAPGILGIDDDLNGTVDEGSIYDNDEDGTSYEETLNGIDDDGDGSIDEDVYGDMNNDGESGAEFVDEDQDGSVDEEFFPDDDEDGAYDEDWVDTITYYLSGNQLLERLPDPHVAGSNYTETVIADNVTQFVVTRLSSNDNNLSLVAISLELSSSLGDQINITRTLRIGNH